MSSFFLSGLVFGEDEKSLSGSAAQIAGNTWPNNANSGPPTSSAFARVCSCCDWFHNNEGQEKGNKKEGYEGELLRCLYMLCQEGRNYLAARPTWNAVLLQGRSVQRGLIVADSPLTFCFDVYKLYSSSGPCSFGHQLSQYHSRRHNSRFIYPGGGDHAETLVEHLRVVGSKLSPELHENCIVFA